MLSGSLPLDDPWPALAAVLCVSAGSLAAAFIGQHVFDIEPCVLCVYQRVPWAAAAVIAALGLLWATRAARRWLILVCALVFVAGAALAFYHVGVQQHWWTTVAACGGTSPASIGLDDLRPEALAAKPAKPCDVVDFRFLGLSLAGWNVIASSFAALAALVAFLRLSRKAAP